MDRVRLGVLALVAVCGLGGCLHDPLVPCGDLACPAGTVCTPGGCATQTDVDACANLTEGASCRASNGGVGTCAGGACRSGLCGNGKLDLEEVCDDGNQNSGDGCRGDCAKIELCGDGEVDQNETCDDGNQNPADGCDACVTTRWNVSVAVGSQVPATQVGLAQPNAIAIDGLGRLFIADTTGHRVRRVDVDGSITTVAGTGSPGFSGDGGPATSAQLASPGGIAVDGLGRIFVADTENQRVRRVDVDGTITTIAGTGTAGYDSDGSAAILRAVNYPRGVAVDGFGSVYVADSANHRIRRIDLDDSIVTVAGTGVPGYDGDGLPATSSALASPFGVAIDTQGRILIADSGNQRVRRVELDGTLATIAGNGTAGSAGDGGAATSAELNAPLGVAVSGTRVFIADTLSSRVRQVDAGTITTIAGIGIEGFAGDGGAATTAQLARPYAVAADESGAIAIADTVNQRVRRIDTTGTIATVAGNGSFGSGGDAVEATAAKLSDPFKVYFDPMGRLIVSDTRNHRVRRVAADGAITTVAGIGIGRFGVDGGLAVSTPLNNPTGVAFDTQGRIVFADSFTQRIRRIELDGTITTIAGKGTNPAYSGDGGPAINCELYDPFGIVYDGQGRLLIADSHNHRIRRVDTAGIITTIAGNGQLGAGGDGGPATSAQLAYPSDLAVDAMGRIYIADNNNNRIRRIELDSTITTVAGTGVAGYSGDNGLATAAQLSIPNSVAIDAQGDLLIADTGNHRIRRIAANGTITTVAGTGVRGESGDGGPAASALLAFPSGVSVDAMGRIVIADAKNSRIRRIALDGTITTVVGPVDPENIGPVATARLADPRAITLAPTFTLVAGGTSGTVEVIRSGRVDAVAGRYPQATATSALARFRTDTFGEIGGVAIDPTTSKIYVTETSANRLHVITQADPTDPTTWTITPVANVAGTAGFAGGAAATARFRSPTGLYLDANAHTLYIADTGNHAIRALDLTTNTVTTVVNASGNLGSAGDGGTALAAQLYRPSALTKCVNGDLFIADTGNNRIRRVAAGTTTVSTVLGDGIAASSGEGSPARTFPVDGPLGIACDSLGNVFVTSATTIRMLPATDDHLVDGEGPVETIYAGSQTMFPGSMTRCLSGITVTGASTVQFADACSGLLVQLDRAPVP